MATVRGYSLVVQASDSPRYVAGLDQSTCGGSLFPATYAAGDQAPATLRLTGKTRLMSDTTANRPVARRHPLTFRIAPENEKGRRVLPLRP